ncbi:laminin subunit gamma-1 [Octopus sinensis]|uniref:Laminin subunit gamma-1 n=1 Tax=Octopus sinensis TaxID=2607531 RepID=A0A6P7SEY9_9MOLL|nr:laminin subunit gamma-1 [Octopus sinensis]
MAYGGGSFQWNTTTVVDDSCGRVAAGCGVRGSSNNNNNNTTTWRGYRSSFSTSSALLASEDEEVALTLDQEAAGAGDVTANKSTAPTPPVRSSPSSCLSSSPPPPCSFASKTSNFMNKKSSSQSSQETNYYFPSFCSSFLSLFRSPAVSGRPSFSLNTMFWLISIGLLLLASERLLVSGQRPHEPTRSRRPPTSQRGSDDEDGSVSCYGHRGRARKCTPDFENAAFSLPVEATNICGMEGPQVYCLQVGVRDASKSCHYCDARHAQFDHSPHLMTDYEGQGNWTWWQSETMLKDVQYPNSVNLTLHLKKAFDITYVSIRFHSSRPESFAIYKRTTEDGEWIPYQYYSSSCERTYGLRPKSIITAYDESKAVCSDEFSDISPLSGGTVVFSTLEGRPSSRRFDTSRVLQDFVTATDIRITLNRINTFRDEVFGDPQVLRSYFYAISDIAIGARCKCNGHAKACEKTADNRVRCKCEHNTAGVSCEKCSSFYNDRPWKRATETDAQECLQCNCNGKSRECIFNQTLYDQTGHGGYCINCRDNTAGPACDQCKVNHFLKQPQHMCMPCNCNPIGSVDLQCNNQGKCQCKPGVTGDRCDRCQANFYDFSNYGCRPCNCKVEGSLNNTPYCDTATGKCTCKANVDGQKCDRCKNGFFGMEESNKFGCIACFCYGHSSSCQSANGFYGRSILSQFSNGRQRWKAADRGNREIPTQFNAITKKIGVAASGNEIIYFMAPERYLHDQRHSYNQFLSFKLQTSDDRSRPSIMDVVLVGSEGQTISTPIFSQGNPTPNTKEQTFRFRLHEHQDYKWQPRLRAQDFIALLSNLTAIKIKGTYNTDGTGFIDDVRLETAGYASGKPASWVEQCTCPDAYLGENCQSCSPGFRRDPPNGGPFARCIPCVCNGHSDDCDVNTGRCICKHNTAGRNCEQCLEGFYGDAKGGTPNDCRSCPCPNNGTCTQLDDKSVHCTNCPEGYGGDLCQVCLDGYYGDPTGRYGPRTTCKPCPCNGNIDLNAVGNCNRTTGECLICLHNTAGFYCERCLPNYYGDALALPKGQCKACNCNPKGILHTGMYSCDPRNGQCPCQLHVEGLKCDRCAPGYWNLESGNGCESCRCNSIGSLESECDHGTGQCKCKNNIVGKRCGKCLPYHYGFSVDGCKRCQCDPLGSYDQQCDDKGACKCRPTTTGDRCDRCQENKYNITAGCIDCPPCYNLVQQQVNEHRKHLEEMRNYTEVIKTSPQAFNDSQFLTHMKKVSDSVEKLINDARRISRTNSTFGKQLDDLKNAISDIMDKCGMIAGSVEAADKDIRRTQDFITEAQDAIRRAEREIARASDYIDNEGQTALKQAQLATTKFGTRSDKMKSIAARAMLTAKQQMSDAKETEENANEALNISRDALQTTKDLYRFPERLANEISRLNSMNENNKNLMHQTEILSKNAKMKAEDALNKALEINTKIARFNISNVNVDHLVTEAEKIKQEANEIQKSLQETLTANNDMLNDVDEEKRKANLLYEDALNKQQETDKLMSDIFKANSKAKEAVEKGEAILKEAQETLKTLKDFDRNVADNKKKAEKSLTKVGDIKKMIRQAEAKTAQSQTALLGAEDDAKEALDKAKEAQDMAGEASKDADKFLKESQAIETRANSIASVTDSLSDQVNKMNSSVNSMKDSSEEDTDAVNNAAAKASRAKDNADEALSKIRKALDTVNEINTVLDNLDSQKINTTHLDILERKIISVEDLMKSNDIDNQMKMITDALKRLTESEDTFTRDLAQLRADVKNIEDINNSLPKGCFKPLNLEKTK